MSLNMIVLQGRLTRDPEMRVTPNGVNVASVGLAVDRFAKAGEEKKCDFFDVQAWRKTAEFLCKYFHKGDMILMRGSMQSRTWDDKDTGKPRTGWNAVADEVFFCGGKSEAPSRTPDVPYSEPAYADPAGDFAIVDDGTDIPF